MTENLDIADIKRLLGFTIPSMDPKQSLEFFKANFKKDYQKLIQEFTLYKGDELDKLTKSKPKSPERIKKGGSTSKGNIQNQISHMKLNDTETAFFVARLRNSGQILSDADANKNKQNPNAMDGDEELGITFRTEEVPNKNLQAAPNNEDQNIVLCICGKDDPGKVWFQCNGCDGWFHPECLGYTKEQIEFIQQQGENELWFHSEECRERQTKAGDEKGDGNIDEASNAIDIEDK